MEFNSPSLPYFMGMSDNPIILLLFFAGRCDPSLKPVANIARSVCIVTIKHLFEWTPRNVAVFEENISSRGFQFFHVCAAVDGNDAAGACHIDEVIIWAC